MRAFLCNRGGICKYGDDEWIYAAKDYQIDILLVMICHIISIEI